MVTADDEALTDVIEQLQQRIDALPPDLGQRRLFLGAYLRTTAAVDDALANAGFEDPAWVRRWLIAFADLFLAAHDADLADRQVLVSRPWRLVFATPAEVPPLRHVLLGVTAHVTYDLPQALLTTISDDDFADPASVASRRRDHERIDMVLAERISAEEHELGPHPIFDRLLAPLNRSGTRRLLSEGRVKVWSNVEQLQAARLLGGGVYRTRLAELEVLATARINDLLEPGQVLLRLAVAGFGVLLPPADSRFDSGPHPDEQQAGAELPRQRSVTAQRRRSTAAPR